MNRKLKVLGLSLVAVFAMSAVVAASASATTFTAATYPASVSGTGGGDVFRAFNTNIVCNNSSFQSETLTAAKETLTVTPTYTNCEFGTLPATVNFTSCDYDFKAGALISGSTFAVSATVKCATAGDHIDITVYASKKAHEEEKPICHVFVPEQNLHATSHLTATNEGGKVKLAGNVEGITATQNRTSFVCPAGEHDTTGKYTINGSVTVGSPNTSVDVG